MKDKTPILELRFDVESAYALRQEEPTEANWQKWIAESLAAVDVICRILNKFEAPATFFMVGLLLEKAGDRYAALLKDNPRFDIQSHTYSHCNITTVPPAEFREELSRTSELIVKYFGKRPAGFCAPGNFYKGLQGISAQLQIKMLWEEGYKFIGTDGQGPAHARRLVPFTQPYWYRDFPGLLELPVTGWHCNMLFNSGHQHNDWRGGVGFPDGSVLEKLPQTVEEGYAVRRKEFEFAIRNNLVYAPGMHPWSIYRFDPELVHLRKIIELAACKNVPIMSCRQVYDLHKNMKRNGALSETKVGIAENLPDKR